MINTQYIQLDMVPTGVMPVLYCSQYDVGRPLGVVVYNRGEAVDLTAYTCTIEATRTDGTAITAAVTTDGSIGVFTTTATMTNQADKYPAKLVLFDSQSRRVASLAFVVCVTPATMDENAESIEEDQSLYQQYTGTVQTLIATERQQRQSADSALQANINSEASARAAGDSNLSAYINAEATARQSADETLQTNIDAEAATRAAQDAVLQAEIDQMIAPSGEAPSAAEVQNARIGANGTTYTTLGNAIRGQITEVTDELESSDEPGKNLLYSAKWVEGGVTVTMGANAVTATAQRAGSWLSAYVDIDVSDTDYIFVSYDSVASGNDKIRYGTVTNGTVSWVAFVNNMRYRIDTSSINTLRFALYVTTSSSVSAGATITYNKLQVEKGHVFTGFSSISYSAHDYMARNRVSETTEVYNLAYDKDRWISSGATLTFSGDDIIAVAPESGTYKSAYIDIDVTGYDHVTIACEAISPSSTEKIRYGKDPNAQGTSVTWVAYITQTVTVIDTSAIDVLRIALYVTTYASVSANTSVTFSGLQINSGTEPNTFAPNYSTAIDYSARQLVNKLAGAGAYTYKGEKIQLTALDATRYFAFETWKDFTSSNTPNIADYKLYNHQSIAIFDYSLFAFQSDGGVVVFDLASKNAIGTGTLPTTAYQHSNSAEFLDVYYNAADPFPILMNSRCGNSNTASGTTPREYDRCEFYRISVSGSTYSFELINTATLNVNSYGMTWSYDKGARTIYAAYTTKGNWSVSDNETAFYGFRLSPAEIISGTPITFSTDDAIRYCLFDYLITVQGVDALGGLLYCGVTQGALQANIRQRLYVIDPVANRIVSDVVLQQVKETEGVTIHDGSIYVSFRDSTDTSSANPMIINRYEF